MKIDHGRKLILLAAVACLSFALALALVGCGNEQSTTTSASAEDTNIESTTSATTPTNSGAAPTKVISQSAALPDHLLDVDQVFPDADAVIVGRVVELLPFRDNPLADPNAEVDTGAEPLPVTYRGAVVEVSQAYGPQQVPEKVTIFYLSLGEYTKDGQKTKVEMEGGLELQVDDHVLLPITGFPRFGTPLGPQEYWVYHEVTAFRVDPAGNATRAVSSNGYAENKGWSDEYELSTLTAKAAAEAGSRADRLSQRHGPGN